MTVLPADRGARQRLKILQLLAAVEADGRTPLDEALLTGVNRLRRGMTAIVVTSSQDASFVRPLADAPDPRHRRRGRAPRSRAVRARAGRGRRRGRSASAPVRVRHALSEFEIPTYVIRPQQALAEALAR